MAGGLNTKNNDIREGRGKSSSAHLIIPRYATAPPKMTNGEIWYDTTNDVLKINLEGTVVTFAKD
jgi:hypothetical protein